jgi:hypothetical protein
VARGYSSRTLHRCRGLRKRSYATRGGEYEFGAQDGAVYEYACHEGNYGLENILAGARAEDAEAAAAEAEPVAATSSSTAAR